MLESLFNEVARPETLLKRDSNTPFSVNIAKFLQTPILKSSFK